MNIDKELTISSSRVFDHLDDKHLRILKILAKHGFLNQKEIGHQASFYYPSDPLFRWEVKKRLEGSFKHLGLIPNEFVYAINKNKKEKRYGLTIKGIMAVLPVTNFEEIHSVIEFRKILVKFNKKRKITKWAFDWIKFEMALILFYNYSRGLDLTRFKKIRSYIDKYKKYDHETIQTFFVNIGFMSKKDKITYDSILKKYWTYFFILDKVTEEIPWGETREYFEEKKFENKFRMFVDMWYEYMDMRKISSSPVREDWERRDLLDYYDEEMWRYEIKEPRKEAYRILKKFKYI